MIKQLRFAFRITHIDNIPHIVKYGITSSHSPNRNDKYVNIGDSQIIGKRQDCLPNGLNLSEYIPFYFGPRSPMLYVIQHGYNNVKLQEPANIIYCVIRLSDLIEDDIDCIFCDGHALDAYSEFYDKSSLNDIDNIINYDDVYAQYWITNEDSDLKRRKEAELLIKTDLPPKYIRGFVVFNNEAKTKLLGLGIPEYKIAVKPQYYF